MRKRKNTLSFLLPILFINNFGVFASAEEYRPLEHFGQGFADTVSPENLPILGVGLGLTVVSLYVDSRWDSFRKNNGSPLGEVGRLASSTKTEIIPLLIGGTTMLFGQIAQKSDSVSAGLAQLEAIVAYSATVASLKFFTYRNGPNGNSEHHAFPSGQCLFVTAGSFSKLYGFAYSIPLLAVGTFGMADYALKNGHWLSDLIFGGFLGFAMGRAFVDHHKKDLDTSVPKVSVYPVIDRQKLATSNVQSVYYGIGLQVNY